MNSKPNPKQNTSIFATIPENVLVRLLIDNLPNAIFVQDAAGCFVLCNQKFALYHAMPVERIIGKSSLDLQPDAQTLQSLTKEQSLIRNGTAPYDKEEYWIHPLTREVSQVKIKKIPLISNGEILGVLGIVDGLQIPSNSALEVPGPNPSNSTTAGEPTPAKPHHTLLRAMIDLLPVMIYAKDVHSKFLECNTVIALNMGTTREELIGKTDFDFFPDHMAKVFFDDEQDIIRSGKPMIDQEEQALDYATGVIRTLSTSKIPFRDASGNIIGIVGIGRDITEFRESEHKQGELQQQLLQEIKQREGIEIDLRLAQKLESVGRLAAGIAHEVNTPIQFVSDSLYFLRSAFDDLNTLLTTYRSIFEKLLPGAAAEEFRDVLAQAEIATDHEFLQNEVPRAFERTFNGTERIANIVRAMKEFAHPDVTEHTQADINHALQTTLVVATNEYKYIAAVHTHFAELPYVMCNIGELNQVFLNLIVNAAHAIHEAGKDVSTGEIHIYTEATDEKVTIRISDNGRGIPTEHLDKIYDPFFTTKEVGRGTGQGLAITHSIIVDKHGGQISVNSNVGVGTEFTLQLPIIGRVNTTVQSL